jgi:hypothetical protein
VEKRGDLSGRRASVFIEGPSPHLFRLFETAKCSCSVNVIRARFCYNTVKAFFMTALAR